MILTQSLSDIEDIYGTEKRKIICDNCRIKIVLSATDSDTQEYLSKLVGTCEAVRKTRTYGTDGEARHSYTTVERPIIRPEEFGYLQDESIVLLPDGYMRLTKKPVFGTKK